MTAVGGGGGGASPVPIGDLLIHTDRLELPRAVERASRLHSNMKALGSVLISLCGGAHRIDARVSIRTPARRTRSQSALRRRLASSLPRTGRLERRERRFLGSFESNLRHVAKVGGATLRKRRRKCVFFPPEASRTPTRPARGADRERRDAPCRPWTRACLRDGTQALASAAACGCTPARARCT